MANRPAAPLLLREGDREALQRLVRSTSVRAGLAQRARIVLLAADGISNTDIGEKVLAVGLTAPSAACLSLLTDDERSAAREKAPGARTADTAGMPVFEAYEFDTRSAITAAALPAEGERFYKKLVWLAASATEARGPAQSSQSPQLLGSDAPAEASGSENLGLGFRDGDEYTGF